MKKILKINEAIKIAEELKKQKNSIVLCGGCFDILHIGHILFLKESKKTADYLFVLLESDKSVKKTKGENRPINTQKDRAEILASLKAVDYVVMLPGLFKNNDYDSLLIKIKPDIIATTKGDPGRIHKERQAKIINAKLIDVIEQIENRSTSRLAKLIRKEFSL